MDIVFLHIPNNNLKEEKIKLINESIQDYRKLGYTLGKKRFLGGNVIVVTMKGDKRHEDVHLVDHAMSKEALALIG